LLLDKIELLQAIELLKEQILSLKEGTSMFANLLENAKRLSLNPSFITWRNLQTSTSTVNLMTPLNANLIQTANGDIQDFSVQEN